MKLTFLRLVNRKEKVGFELIRELTSIPMKAVAVHNNKKNINERKLKALEIC